jgi:hypothetical protein
MNAVNTERGLVGEANRVIRNILQELPGFRAYPQSKQRDDAAGYDLLIRAVSPHAKLRFGVTVRSRITPQTALAMLNTLSAPRQAAIPVIYSPVISPRVIEIIREHGRGVGYVDRAGNCLLLSSDKLFLVNRVGFDAERPRTRSVVDPFSTKSSRIVRALLTYPADCWQTRKLADHPEVQVSPGLAVKVKQSLIHEGYAVERERRLCLRDAAGLLNAWIKQYSGPIEQLPLYVRGDTGAAEKAVSDWCLEEKLHHALAGLSAAWRLAPEVRYSYSSIYVEGQGFESSALERLAARFGAKRVTSGANVFLWKPYDSSVFAFRDQAIATSPLQTYLDLCKAAGRSEEAAKAIFERYLKPSFDNVARAAE